MNDILESNDGEGFEQFSGDEDLAGPEDEYELRDLSDTESNPEALITGQEPPLTAEDVSLGIKRLETDLKNNRITMRHFNNAAIDAFKILVEFSLYSFSVNKNDPVYEKIIEDYDEFARKFKNSDDFKLGHHDVSEFLDRYREVLKVKKAAESRAESIDLAPKRLTSGLEIKIPTTGAAGDQPFAPGELSRLKKNLIAGLDNMDPAHDMAVDEIESWTAGNLGELQKLADGLNAELKEFSEPAFSEDQIPEAKRVVGILAAQFTVRNDSLVQLFKESEIVRDFETKSLAFLKAKYSSLVSTTVFMTDLDFEVNDQIEDMISRLRQEQEDDREGNSRRVFSDEELRDDFYSNGDIRYLRKKYGRYVKDNSFFRDLKIANEAKIDRKFYAERPRSQLAIDALFRGINFHDSKLSPRENAHRVKVRMEFVYNFFRGVAETKGLLDPESESEKYCLRYIDHLYTDLSGSLVTERADFRKNGFGPSVLVVPELNPAALRPMCERVRVLKPVNMSRLITWMSKTLDVPVEDLYMTREQMELFRSTNEKALRVQARDFHMNVHNLVIEKELTFNRKRLLDSYDRAFKIAKARGDTDIPSRDPLVFEYPPRPVPESASDVEHENYARAVASYEARIREFPELSPFEPDATYQEPNAALDKFSASLFGSLVTALKKVPVYGYFKLAWSPALAAELDSHVTRDAAVEALIKAATVAEKDQETGMTVLIVPSLHDVVRANPTFQVLPETKSGVSVFVKNREFKIRQVRQRGGFTCAWFAPTDSGTHLEEFVDFTDYLRRMQQMHIREYTECFRQSPVSRQTYFRSVVLSNHIAAVNMYLVMQGLPRTPFTRITVPDVNAETRLSVRDALTRDFPASKSLEIEELVHGFFTDIYDGTMREDVQLQPVPDTVAAMDLVIRAKSQVVGAFLGSSRPSDPAEYRLYKYLVSYAAFKAAVFKDLSAAEAFSAEFPVSPELLYGITVAQRYLLLSRLGFNSAIELTAYNFSMSRQIYDEISRVISTADIPGDPPAAIARLYMDVELQKVMNTNSAAQLKDLVKVYESSIRAHIKSKHLPLFAEFLLSDFETRLTTKKNPVQFQEVLVEPQSSPADAVNTDALDAVLEAWFSAQGAALTKKDLKGLQRLDIDQRTELSRRKHVPFMETRFLDITEARTRGLLVRINKAETFAVAGEFPDDPIAYRYRDPENPAIIRSRLVDICRFAGSPAKDPEIPEFFGPPADSEMDLLRKVWEFKASRVVVLVGCGGRLRNLEEIRGHLVKYGGFKDLSDNNVLYVLFGNATERDLLPETKVRKTDTTDYGISGYLHSILVTDAGEIVRRVHKALEKEQYPVPIRYTGDGTPVFSRDHKQYLKHLIEAQQFSPYLKNKIQMHFVDEISREDFDRLEKEIHALRRKLKRMSHADTPERAAAVTRIEQLSVEQGRYRKLVFSGTVPFLVDESSSTCLVSDYYVEQVFRDANNHGAHMVYRIGVDETKSRTPHTYMKRMNLADPRLDVNPEMEISNKFFKGDVSPQSETFDLVSKRIEQTEVSESQLAVAGAFSVLDSHAVKPKLKYDPVDVWTWNFEKDKKAHVASHRGQEQLFDLMRRSLENPTTVSFTSVGFSGSSDFETWTKEYKQTVAGLRESLARNGSASSKFIDDVNEASKRLQEFRQNLPSQLFRASHGVARPVPEPRPHAYDYVVRLVPDFNVEFLYKCFQVGLLRVEPDALQMIREFSSQFPGYQTFDIVFDKFVDGRNTVHHQTLKNVPGRLDSPYAVVYGILENFSRTKTLVLGAELRDAVARLDALDTDAQVAVFSEHPLALVLSKLKKSEWTVLRILEQAVSEFYSDMSGDVIWFKLATPVTVTRTDVLEFLGDSNYMNALYHRGLRKVATAAERVIDYVVSPGGRFVVYNRPSVLHTKFEIPREVTRAAPLYINQMVIGSEKSEHPLCDAGARRAALVFNVNLTSVDPYFSVANAYTSYTKRHNVALTKDDVVKFVAKGGIAYTVMEMTDNEVAARSAAHEVNENQLKKRKIQYSNYSRAVTEYIFSKDKDVTLRGLLAEVHFGTQYKKYDRACLVKYIEEVQAAISTKKIAKNRDSVKMYISQLHIFPDFLVDNWDERLALITKDFRDRFGLELAEFLKCNRKNLEMAMAAPDSLLDVEDLAKLPFGI